MSPGFARNQTALLSGALSAAEEKDPVQERQRIFEGYCGWDKCRTASQLGVHHFDS